MVWVWRDLKGHLAPAPCLCRQENFHLPEALLEISGTTLSLPIKPRLHFLPLVESPALNWNSNLGWNLNPNLRYKINKYSYENKYAWVFRESNWPLCLKIAELFCDSERKKDNLILNLNFLLSLSQYVKAHRARVGINKPIQKQICLFISHYVPSHMNS